MKKRCLALLLAVVLIFSSFPMAIFAQGIEQEGGSGQENQVIEENANLEDEQVQNQDSLKEEDEQNVLKNQDIETNALPTIALAGAPVNYCDAKGVEQVCTNYTVVTSNMDRTWTAGWYVVEGNVRIDGGVIADGNVHLILTDGSSLTINGQQEYAGIHVKVFNGYSSLTIYGQKGGSGKLNAKGGKWAAGIGGSYHDIGEHNATRITINGGIIVANGGFGAAGIGGSLSGDAHNITINGGNVTAEGGINGAGIGGGFKGRDGGNGGLARNITINGGTVNAIGGNGSGIGSGYNSAASSGIKVSTDMLVLADNNVVSNNGGDLSGALSGKANVQCTPHTHQFSYTANGAVITAKCTARICPTKSEYQLTLKASNAIYDGQQKAAKIEGNIPGVNNPEIYYEGVETTTYAKTTEVPKAVGTYRATISMTGSDGKEATASVIYTIHQNEWIYTANGAVITAKYTGSSRQTSDLTLTLIASSAQYDGQPKAARIKGSIPGVNNPEIYYEGVGTTTYAKTTTAPTECGEYRATISMIGSDEKVATAFSRFTIKNEAGIRYVDENGNEQICPSAKKLEDGLVNIWFSYVLQTGWYVVDRDLIYNNPINIEGDVHLIFTEGHTLRVDAELTAGLAVSERDHLTIYGQMGGTGTLIANGGINGAGIGGFNSDARSIIKGENITINGGHVIATGANGIGSVGDIESKNIKVRSALTILAGSDQNHLLPISHLDGEDISKKLSKKPYVEIIDAPQMDDLANDNLQNENAVSEDTVSEDSVIEDAVSENTVSEVSTTKSQTNVNTNASLKTGIDISSNLPLTIGLTALAVILAVVVITLKKRDFSEE